MDAVNRLIVIQSVSPSPTLKTLKNICSVVLYQKFHFPKIKRINHDIRSYNLHCVPKGWYENCQMTHHPLGLIIWIEIWSEEGTTSGLAGEDIKPITPKCNVLTEGTYQYFVLALQEESPRGYVPDVNLS